MCIRDSLSDLVPLARGLSQTPSLKQLSLSLAYCTEIWDLAVLANGLSPGLCVLFIDMRGCRQISSLEPLAQRLQLLGSLESLELCFAQCEQLSDVNGLGRCLPKLQALRKFALDLSECDRICSALHLAQGLGELAELEDLCLNLNNCEHLGDVAALGRCLRKMKALRNLKVDIDGCDLPFEEEKLFAEQLTSVFQSRCCLLYTSPSPRDS
eukprot:TRINITY_DN15074_c0_g1_i1.p1 TRINITY_DN15074_c0_g1~~TRINITY_DN15074_c0_g1_i1.p1  ORF type:complete len:211 (+),score=47.93 TRINITY_DN15074_c0_g1_i1:139-771(+)